MKKIVLIILQCIYMYSFSSYIIKDFNRSALDTINLHGRKIQTNFSPVVINQYDKRIRIVLDEKKPDMIPKVMHFIWIGSSFPKYLDFCLNSWKFHHPAWDIRVWSDSNISEIISNSDIEYSEIANLGAKVDILRLEILKKYGGIYVDTDFFCLKPIDDLIKLDFFISSECNLLSLVNNGIIGATPNNHIIKKMLMAIKQNLKHQKKAGYFDVLTATGPFWVTKFFSNMLVNNDWIVIPPSYFCSFPIYEKERFWNCDLSLYGLLNKYTFEESIAVHLWHSSWNISCPMGENYKNKKYYNDLEINLRQGLVDPLDYKELDFVKPYLLIKR